MTVRLGPAPGLKKGAKERGTGNQGTREPLEEEAILLYYFKYHMIKHRPRPAFLTFTKRIPKLFVQIAKKISSLRNSFLEIVK